MDKFIKLLLETENTVILPGFGAVVVENENTGKLMFNEYLSYNDGKLAKIILDNSNMSEQEVQNYIAKHVREIQITLDKGEAYAIFELGEFSKDKEGKVEFNGNKNSGSTTESTSKVAVPPVNDHKQEKTTKKSEEVKQEKSEVEEAKKEEKPKPISSKESTTSEIEKETAPKAKDKKDKADKVDKEKKENKYTPSLTEEKTDKSTAKTPTEINKEKAEVKEKKKKSPIKYVLLVLIILIGGAAIFIGLNYNEVKVYMGWDKFEEVEEVAQIQEDLQEEEPKNEDIQNDIINDSIASDGIESDTTSSSEEENNEAVVENTETAVEEVVQPKEEVATPLPSSNTGEYHLIAGTFSEKSNAEKFVEELKSSGLPAKMIGPYNNMHYVSASSFNSAESANKKAPELRQKGISVWTYKQPY